MSVFFSPAPPLGVTYTVGVKGTDWDHPCGFLKVVRVGVAQ